MLNYVYITDKVMSMLIGKHHTLSVLMCLAFHRNTSTNRSQFMSKPRIAKLSGVSRRQVYLSIDSLIELGLIEEVAERRGEYMYHLPYLNDDSKESTKTNEPVEVVLENLMKQYREI